VPLPRAVAVGPIALALALASPAAASPQATAPARLAKHDGALVALNGNARAERLVRASGGRLVSGRLDIWRLRGTVAARLVPRLERLGALRYAEPERARPEGVHFTDPLSGPDISWHLYAVGANQVEPPGPGFPITVIDAGLDLGHMDFAGRPNVTALNPQTTDFADVDEYHGTIVSWTAAAATNGVGGEGVYPQAVLRVYDVEEATSAGVVAGIDAALKAGPSVINLSLGGPVPAVAEYEAILLAMRSGSLVVAASGNSFEFGNPSEYPADFPHVLTVGAIERSLQPASFSSSGAALDLVAPGVEIPFADPFDPDPARSIRVDGTSFAAPIVTAAAAWVKTARPDLSVAQVAEVLRRSATDLGAPGFDRRTGFGLLNIPAALSAPVPAVDFLEPNDDVPQVTAALFGRAQAAVNGSSGHDARIAATIDTAEDPHDVYRVVVPAGRRLVVTTSSAVNLRAALWGARASTVTSGKTQRIAFSNRPGKASENVAWTNKAKRAATVYLDVAAAGDGVRGGYTAALRLVRAPR
jgi:Subtilase family